MGPFTIGMEEKENDDGREAAVMHFGEEKQYGRLCIFTNGFVEWSPCLWYDFTVHMSERRSKWLETLSSK